MSKAEKKNLRTIIGAIIAIFVLLVTASCFHINDYKHTSLVFTAGKIVSVKETPGVYFTAPLLGSSTSLFMGERLYALNVTNTITSDKKSLDVNAISIWEITDPVLYYTRLNSVTSAQARLETDLFSAMKKVISATLQADVISGKDGSLSQSIAERVDFSEYGMNLVNYDIKLLDLPEANKEAVFELMKSEREIIAASYKAEGEKESKRILATANASARETVSNAEAMAAETIAEGEKIYYDTLYNAYSSSEAKTSFFKFWNELEALKVALKNGGTIVVKEDNPLYEILVNHAE